MKKTYNQIKEQAQRVAQIAQERGRYCNNVKNRFDTQRLAQITRNAMTQHGFPIFGFFDANEPHDYIYIQKEQKKQTESKTENTPEQEIKRPTPKQRAAERMSFADWMQSDEKNRKTVQDMARRQFVNKMYIEMLVDMEICKLEGWDIMEFPRMLRSAIMRVFPKPRQLTLFD